MIGNVVNMKSFAKLLGASILGLIAWFVVATVLDRGLRAGWPAYAQVWTAMTFTLPMMFARLLVGAISTVAVGAVAAAIVRDRRVPVGVAVLLLLFFVPEHVRLWDRFPFWYHAVFLGSLAIGPALGARFVRRDRAANRPGSGTVPPTFADRPATSIAEERR